MTEKVVKCAEQLEAAAKKLREATEGMVAYEAALEATDAAELFIDWYLDQTTKE